MNCSRKYFRFCEIAESWIASLHSPRFVRLAMTIFLDSSLVSLAQNDNLIWIATKMLRIFSQ
ncbi:hypothetical protein [Helicobacter sp. 23-1045]